MSNSKKYWKGIEELKETPEFLNQKHNEFAEELPVDRFLGDEQVVSTQTNRRDFLKVLGFSVTAASLAACEAPVRKAIPYLNKPEEITPGVANYYATSYWDGQDYAGLVVKTREGRPIKVDGNELCTITQGGSNARMQASVLSLYDSARLRKPMKEGKDTDWKTIDADVKSKLTSIAASGGAIRILTSTQISPSMNAALTEFSSKYTGTKIISYDAVSQRAIADAHAISHGKAMIPTYNFDKADYIVGIGCDFLANWLSPVEYARQYATKRKVSKDNPNMSRHIQIESLLTLTGSNADKRIALKPSELGTAAVMLLNALTGSSHSSGKTGQDSAVAKVASELAAHKNKALVVCGINDPNIQLVVNAINNHLGSYGTTINKDIQDNTRQGNDKEVIALIEEIKAQKVSALFVVGANPVYSLPNGEELTKLIGKIDLSVSLSDTLDETAKQCKYVAASHHYLESWSDANPRTGHYSLGQPVINPLGNTRQTIESFLTWSGNNSNAHDYVAKYWETNLFPSVGDAYVGGFTEFWNKTLHDGALTKVKATETKSKEAEDTKNVESKLVKREPVKSEEKPAETTPKMDVSTAAQAIAGIAAQTGGVEMVIYEKTGMGWGSQANNPWLQELPDPITRVTWDNYLLMNPDEMTSKGFNVLMGQEQLSNVVEISVSGGAKISLPVVAQPGLPKGLVSAAVGYRRTSAGKTANGIGGNHFTFVGTAK